VSAKARLVLLSVVLVNLLVTTAMGAAALLTDGTFAGYGHVARNGVFFGQGMVLGTLAALVPRRGLTGLLIIVACVLFGGYMLLPITLSLQPTLSRGVPFEGIYLGLFAIAMQLLVSACRIIFGWRVAIGEAPFVQRPGQLQLVEMVELIAICGVWLGLNRMLESDGITGRQIATFGIRLAQVALTGLPLFLAILADQPPRAFVITAFAVWCPLWLGGTSLIPVYDGDFLSHLLRQLPSIALFYCTLFILVAINALMLRQLGYRWYRQALKCGSRDLRPTIPET
jgi:hypothetical protein